MTMKKPYLSIVFMLFLLLQSLTCAAQGRTEWKELSAFHTVMSQTFHPAEEGDLKPIRARSGEMVEKAKAWRASSIPADYKDVKGLGQSLDALVDGSTTLDKKVRAGATDEEITQELSALHEVFHTIVGLCRPGH